MGGNDDSILNLILDCKNLIIYALTENPVEEAVKQLNLLDYAIQREIDK
ncbi:hypothetical protein TCEA9_09890 [Thermobrachium celere]|nr:hypothetical protein TCEA9_09890 [Thermobrachium celere]